MRRNVNQNERKGRIREIAGKAGKFAATAVLVAGLAVAGCAGKNKKVETTMAKKTAVTDTGNEKKMGALVKEITEEAGYTEEEVKVKMGYNPEIEKMKKIVSESKAVGYGEMKKELKKEKAPKPKGSEIEAKEPNLVESESYEFNVGISTYNFITSTMLSGMPVYNYSFVGSEVKLKLNEEFSNCIKQARHKCELAVKKDTSLSHIETNNENNDYMDLKVAKVDDKGIYLSLEMQLMGETTQSGAAEYYRINFDGGVTAILKNGEEVSNEEVDHIVSKILSLVSFNAEAKPSEKEGEATLILHMKGYGEMKKEPKNLIAPKDKSTKGSELLDKKPKAYEKKE